MKTRTCCLLAVFATVFLTQGGALAADTPAAKVSAPAITKKKPAPSVKQMNINAASEKELMTLPGIGEVEAKSIIAGRPYGSKGMLVSKKALPEDKALAIRELVFAGKSAKSGGKKK